ncbi:MAG: GtrA family protein [Oscillospiraceae bacterium]|nr:GtrA family protein [Oscillospiraceae bacterium]
MDIKKIFIQFVKFGSIGAINTILTWAIYMGFVELFTFEWGLGIFKIDDYMVGYTIAFVITVANAYWLQTKFVFDGSGQAHSSKIFKTYTAYFITFLLTQVCLWILISLVGMDKKLAIIPPMFITIPTNFLVHKFWVFKEKN